MGTKSVLVIAYFFPPLGGGGVQRTLKFVKYLPDNGWNPIVLTVREGGYDAFDNTLARELSPDVRIIRTSSIEPTRFYRKVRARLSSNSNPSSAGERGGKTGDIIRSLFDFVFVPDDKLGWFPFALSEGKRLIKGKIDLIYSTAPPYTAHLIAYHLKRAAGAPWVADFRDAWTRNSFKRFPTTLHRNLEAYLERKVINSADRIITATEPLRREWLRAYPGLDASKLITITNGFDPQDFEGIEPEISDKFTISYTGTFYAQRNPYHFLKGLGELLTEKEELKDEIRVNLIGKFDRVSDGIIEEAIQRYGLREVVNSPGYVPHQEGISYLLGADVLLLVIASKEGEAILTGKIFEYLATRKPILALVPKCAAGELIEALEAGRIVPPEDIEGIKKAIYRFYLEYNEGASSPQPLSINEGSLRSRLKAEKLQSFTRQELTKKLSQVFEEVADK